MPAATRRKSSASGGLSRDAATRLAQKWLAQRRRGGEPQPARRNGEPQGQAARRESEAPPKEEEEPKAVPTGEPSSEEQSDVFRKLAFPQPIRDEYLMSNYYARFISKRNALAEIRARCVRVEFLSEDDKLRVPKSVGLLCTVDTVSLKPEGNVIWRDGDWGTEEYVYVLDKPIHFSLYYDMSLHFDKNAEAEVCLGPGETCLEKIKEKLGKHGRVDIYEETPWVRVYVTPSFTVYGLEEDPLTFAYVTTSDGDVSTAVLHREWDVFDKRDWEKLKAVYDKLASDLTKRCGGRASCVEKKMGTVRHVLRELVKDFAPGMLADKEVARRFSTEVLKATLF